MSVVTTNILIEEKPISAIFELLSIEIYREVNRLPYALLIFADGNPAERKFELSDKAFFEPGKKVKIKLGYEGEKAKPKPVFEGVVVRHTIEANVSESLLSVEIKDVALSMTLGRKSEVFVKKTDTKILNDIITKGKAKPGKIPTTKPTHPELIQYNCSDWDFMLTRAEVNNLLVAITDGKIDFHEIAIKGSASKENTFEYGLSEIFSFEMEADALQQVQKVESISWNVSTQKLSEKSNGKSFSLSQGNLNPDTIAGKLGGKESLLNNPINLEPDELQIWADGTMARNRMAFFRGVITVPGYAEVALMDPIEFKGFSNRFNGKTLVTGIRHSVSHEGWETHLHFGLKSDPYAYRNDMPPPPAAGMISAVQGLQIGIVDKFEDDKKGKQFRVRVILPGIDQKKGKVWARLSSPDAGPERGYFFRPEPGDEVVVGFLNDDPRQAVVLGAMFSSINKPPKGWEKLDKDNALKGIVSKSGIKIVIDDKKQTLQFLTSEKQSIMMDEKKKLIEIKDLNENIITLDKKGISIKLAKKLSIEADGDIELKGKNIKLTASANVEIKGKKVDVK